MEMVLLASVEVVLPIFALLFEHVGNVRISERHHRHHDTYVVPVAFTRGLVLAMAFMSVLGLVLGWLCAALEFLPGSLTRSSSRALSCGRSCAATRSRSLTSA